MCVWPNYKNDKELKVGLVNGVVRFANGDKLKKSHPYSEFMELAAENGWEPKPEPSTRDEVDVVTLHRKKY